jgi:hypothetical protein
VVDAVTERDVVKAYPSGARVCSYAIPMNKGSNSNRGFFTWMLACTIVGAVGGPVFKAVVPGISYSVSDLIITGAIVGVVVGFLLAFVWYSWV